MTLEEMQDRCKKAKITSQEEVWAVSPIYILLNFDKDDFCKLIDAIGLEKWVQAKDRWERLIKAEEMLSAKEAYARNKARLEEINDEQAQLLARVVQYENENRL